MLSFKPNSTIHSQLQSHDTDNWAYDHDDVTSQVSNTSLSVIEEILHMIMLSYLSDWMMRLYSKFSHILTT